jgi:hypothetical protein
MMAKFGILVIATLQTQFLWAQFNLLTPSEAARIVEQLPQVLAMAKKLPCLTVIGEIADPRDPATVDIEVRAPCSGYASSLIDRYVVDRRTGVVTTSGDNPSRVGDRNSENLAKTLLIQAKGRTLSAIESRCVALEAARSLPGWASVSSSNSIEPVGAPGMPETLFWLRHNSVSPAAEIRVQLYVDPNTGIVQNMGSGAEVMSAGLGELLDELIQLKSPPLLSDEDALLIALKVSSLARVSQRKDCSLIATSVLGSEEEQVAPACGGQYVNGAGVAVNLRTGLITYKRRSNNRPRSAG